MLIRIIVKALGGIWSLRHKYDTAKINCIKKIYGFLYNYFLQCKGSWISASAKFNSEPCFPHGINGIFISGGAVIGSNCIIFQQVTIGSNSLIDSKGIGSPVIGNNCYIGAGAKIIGNVNVGNNVRIGANAVVYQDVPDNSVVTCAAQRILNKESTLNNNFYHKYKGRWKYFTNGSWRNVQKPEEISLLSRSFSDD